MKPPDGEEGKGKRAMISCERNVLLLVLESVLIYARLIPAMCRSAIVEQQSMRNFNYFTLFI